jgi:lantibiotic biosynthesis protein
VRAYLAADGTLPDDDDAITNHVAAALAAARDTPALGLHGGLTNVAWTIAHFADDANAQEILAMIDAALTRALAHDWRGRYDLVSGLVGIGVYSLERGDAGRPLAARVIEHLHTAAQRRGACLAWHTPSSQLPDWQREHAPDGYFNLGLAHGVPGIIALCARCIAADVEHARATELMSGAISYLREAAPPSPEGRFPSWHTPDGAASGDRTRPAWCYGDLGVASALLAAARVDAVAREEAMTLARSCARRPSHPSVRDAGLCHGAAGIAHIFGRMHQATQAPELGDAARRWLSIALEMRNEHPYAGFPAFDGVAHSWRADSGLLNGAAGVALVLHAMISDVEPRWDRLLLVDLQP